MGESSSDFRDTLLELIDASPEPMDHPSPDQWIAYHRGELAAEEEARLQEHLVRCRDCFDLAAAAAEFAPPDEEPGAGEEVDSAALWRLLRPQLDPSSDPPPQNVREISAGARRRTVLVVPSGRVVLRGAGRPDRLEPAPAEHHRSAAGAEARYPIIDFFVRRAPSDLRREDPDRVHRALDASCSIPPRSSRSTGWRSATTATGRELWSVKNCGWTRTSP